MRTGGVYAGSRLWAWVARGGILQQATHLPAAEAGERVVDPTPQRDDLEQLAHLGWTQELLRLHSQRQIGRCVPGGGERHEIRDAEANQEVGLGGIAEQLQPGIGRGPSDGREIDGAGDILQARQEERIVVGAVTEVAHQRALAALRMVVLALAEPVIDEEQSAAFQDARQRFNQSRTDASDLAQIGRRWIQAARLRKHRRLGQRTVLPGERVTGPSYTALPNVAFVPADQV